MKIGAHPIGTEHPVYVIAEIGSNHGGDLDTAKRYIETAAWAGANAAKFQFYRERELYPGQSTPGAIPDWWLPELKWECEDKGVDFLCSVFSFETLNVYMELDPVAVKIASPESHNFLLLDQARSWDHPVLVATGASTEGDVGRAVRVLDGCEYALLHCTSSYPSPDEETNVRAVSLLRSTFSVPVGLSDHTLHGPAPALAVAYGASIIEKHLTFNRTLSGPDHGFAVEPAEFRQMVDDVRRVRAMLGDGVKRVMPSEDASDRRAA